MCKQLLLASQSPRRQALLAQLGYKFTTVPANIDETVQLDEAPILYVERMAREKASYIASQQSMSNFVVLGADTTVVQNNIILAKPRDLTDCLAILGQLSGNSHQVLTAIAISDGQQVISEVISTQVSFKHLTDAEICRYWHTGEPQDKAGAYGIQGIGGQFVRHITGSYSAVVGLPLYETAELLASFGIYSAVQQAQKE